MPLFSVITVTLNPGANLKPTVASVMEQDFTDWELIVKDGGSTDGSLSCLPSDLRIRVVVQPDTGIFDAMNQALTLAQGDFVHYLNAGDLFIDAFVLSDVATVIRGHPQIPFFYGDVQKPRSRSGYELYPKRLSRRWLFMNNLCHQACFIARRVYAASGGFETARLTGADPRLLLRLLLRDGLSHRHVGRVVVCYRGDGVSARIEHVREAAVWCRELKRELFTEREYAAYSALLAVQTLAKRLVYDTFLWPLIRAIRGARTGKRTSE